MGCFEKFLNWLNHSNIPNSQESIMRDLQTIGIMAEV
jgi:hypothetical protein